MPKAASEKCRLCAKLSADEAIAKHGPFGTSTKCWEPEKCNGLRTYYRNRDRYNAQRRQKYRGVAVEVEVDDGKGTVLTVTPPVVPAAVLYLYREKVDDPLHAIGAELWLGQKKLLKLSLFTRWG